MFRMSTLPNIPSNIKCWRLLNKLVFGDGVSCPKCGNALQENYKQKYIWCRQCRRKYRWSSYKGGWLYGIKLTPRQLLLLLWCWQQRKSLEATVLKVEVSYTTVARWFARFRMHVPDTTPLLSGIVQADESYFSKKKSKQAKYIVTGAVEPDTGRRALRITGDHDTGRRREVLEQFVQDMVAPESLVVTDKWHGYDELPLLGYSHESHNHSKGDYADTNMAENIWSVEKRHARKLYGGRILTFQLPELLTEWMARANKPELFRDPLTFLRFTLVPG